MDLSNFIKITPSKPKQQSTATPLSRNTAINTGSTSKSMSQNQMIGLGLIIFGVVLIGVGILLW